MIYSKRFYDVDVLLPEFVSPQSRYLDRSILQHSITGLQPQTLYSVSIHALYSNTEGPEITLSQQTGTVHYFEELIHRFTKKIKYPQYLI